MSWSIIAACGWLILANVIAMFPSKHKHWPAAYGLITIGVPLLIWLYVENGIWIALVALIAGGWVLRWPVRFAFRWLGRVTGLRE
ncbi:MAG: DUF2484 family protein [Pseudomonadota bacterium]